MNLYDKIYELAADNHGLITTRQANRIGAANKDLTRYVSSGRLTRLGYGVYRIKHHVPEANDPYAEAVALVGSDAFLYGESVIAMHGLAPTDPAQIFVGSPKRVRRRLPSGIKVIGCKRTADLTCYDGIPAQTVPDALRACKATMMRERVLAATDRAREQGLITRQEHSDLVMELEK